MLKLKINKLKFGAGKTKNKNMVENSQFVSYLCGCKRVFEGPLVRFGVTVSVTPIAAVSDSKLNSR